MQRKIKAPSIWQLVVFIPVNSDRGWSWPYDWWHAPELSEPDCQSCIPRGKWLWLHAFPEDQTRAYNSSQVSCKVHFFELEVWTPAPGCHCPAPLYTATDSQILTPLRNVFQNKAVNSWCQRMSFILSFVFSRLSLLRLKEHQKNAQILQICDHFHSHYSNALWQSWVIELEENSCN